MGYYWLNGGHNNTGYRQEHIGNLVLSSIEGNIIWTEIGNYCLMRNVGDNYLSFIVNDAESLGGSLGPCIYSTSIGAAALEPPY